MRLNSLLIDYVEKSRTRVKFKFFKGLVHFEGHFEGHFEVFKVNSLCYNVKDEEPNKNMSSLPKIRAFCYIRPLSGYIITYY